MTPAEILRDFRTKYQHTYAWVVLPDSSKEVLCHIDAVSDQRDRTAVIQLSSNEYGKLVINFASDHQMRFRFPNVGSFQHGKNSLVIQRRAPHRQYQRGFGGANHYVVSATQYLTYDMESEPILSLDVVESAFKAEKYSARDALVLLGKGKHRSVALDGWFSICQPIDDTGLYPVFMGNMFIGKATDKLEFVPYKGAEVYKDEVNQILMGV